MQRTRYTPKIFGIAAPLLALAVVRVLHEYGQPITEQFELIVVDVVDDFHRLYISPCCLSSLSTGERASCAVADPQPVADALTFLALRP